MVLELLVYSAYIQLIQFLNSKIKRAKGLLVAVTEQ